MTLETIMRDARAAKLQLQSDGHTIEANAVQRLLVSRGSSKALNQVLHGDLARLRGLLRRAHDVICRDEQDGAVYAQLLAEMKRELGL